MISRIVIAALIVLPAAAHAQDARSCRTIADSLERLVCYDRMVDQAAAPTAGSTQPQERVISTFSGSGIQQTRPFSVSGEWELRWRGGEYLAMVLYDTDGKMAGMFGAGAATKGGSAYQPKGGVFYLIVSGIGDWRIEAVQIGRR